jgi:probable HAF family extracellular repeat protein
VATAINWAGSVVGYSTDGEGSYPGFVLHPDGYSSGLTVPLPPQPEPECMAETFPDAINAAGTIAGWYYNRCNPENMGFMTSPDGVFTVFAAPGAIVASLSFDFMSTAPHWISIDQAGDIAGSYTAGLGFSTVLYATLMEPSPPSIRRRAIRPPRPASAMEARSPGSIITMRAADSRWALSAYRSRLALQIFFMSHIRASRNLITA